MIANLKISRGQLEYVNAVFGHVAAICLLVVIITFEVQINPNGTVVTKILRR